MRFLKPIIGAILFVSVLINIVLIYKVKGKRPIITVNGAAIVRSDMTAFLEEQYGAQYKAAAIRRLLVDQEAHQQSVAPTDAEVDEEFNNKRELDWTFAQQLQRSPWMLKTDKDEMKCIMEENQLRTKDITVTAEEIKEEYLRVRGNYDSPDKARCSVAAILNESRTDDVRRMLASTSPPYSPATIADNFRREVLFLGDNNIYTFARPYNSGGNAQIFNLQPKQVIVDAPGPLGQLGAKKVVIRMEEIIPGNVADLNDPKTRKKISLQIALLRAKPANELLYALWSKANMVFDEPNDKTNAELILFPDKVQSK